MIALTKKNLNKKMLNNLGIVDSYIVDSLNTIKNVNMRNFLIGYISICIHKGSTDIDFKKLIAFMQSKEA